MTDDRKGELADETFTTWFNDRLTAYRVPAEEIVANDKAHHPMFMVYLNDVNEVAVLPVPPDFMADRDAPSVLAKLQRELASQDRVYAVIVVMEAWTLWADQAPDYKGGSIAHHPERREALVLNAVHGRQQLIATLPIDRATRTLGEAMVVDPMTNLSGGRMVLNQPTKH